MKRKRLFFEGRTFDLSRLSAVRRHGRRIYATYYDAPIIMASYDGIDDAKQGREYIREKTGK